MIHAEQSDGGEFTGTAGGEEKKKDYLWIHDAHYLRNGVV